MTKFERWAAVATETAVGHAKAANVEIVTECTAEAAGWRLGDRSCTAKPSTGGRFASLVTPSGETLAIPLVAVEESGVVAGAQIFSMLYQSQGR